MSAEKNDLKNKAYMLIKDNIVNCSYPPGYFIKEKDLMSELNISRTPIREAISRLDQENLVKAIPRRGVMVSEIGYQEVNDIFQVRLMLEPYILQTYYNKAEKNSLIHFKNAFQENTEDENTTDKYKIDDNFHSYFINLCPNKYLVHLLAVIFDQNHRLRILSGNSASRLSQSTKEHINIIDALLEGDIDKAVKLYTIHIQNSRQSAIDCLTTF